MDSAMDKGKVLFPDPPFTRLRMYGRYGRV